MLERDLVTLELRRVLEAVAVHARSAAGRDTLLAWQPFADAASAQDRLDILAELVALSREARAVPSADVARLVPILRQAAPAGAVLDGAGLVEVRDLLEVARHVRVFLRRSEERFPRLACLAAGLPEVPEVEALLRSLLDETGQVREEANPALADARRTTRELRERLEQALLAVVRDPASADVVAERYVTVRNGRYVVPIRTAAAAGFAGVVQDRSQSDETVYIEPFFAVELNNRLVLAVKAEEVEERRVRGRVTQAIREHAGVLASLEAALAEVDAFGAAVAFAIAHDARKPRLGAADVQLPAARHPLLVLSGRPVVPIDIHLGPEQRGLAITGPNAGGKTVALKTLGLAALMAQCGLFVLAGEDSRLPCFAAILADIGDEQSIEHDLSTFTGHAENLARIAAAASPGALVLLDEPGAGTDPVEGAALAVGVLTDLLERGPRVVFTTHYPLVKTFALAQPALDVAAFDVDARSGAPRFQLRYGTVGQSLALPIARGRGIPQRALDVAERLLSGENHDLALAVERLERSRLELEAARNDALAERAHLAEVRAELEQLRAELRERQRRRWAEELAEARRFVESLRARGQELLEQLRERPEPAALRTYVTQAAGEIAALASAVEAGPSTPPRPPRVGDTVEVIGRGIRGELIELTSERARLRRGGLKFEVPATQVRLVPGTPSDIPRQELSAEPASFAEEEAVPLEVNVMGRRAEDAVRTIAATLDRAVRAGLPELRVVHGVGSGALRRAIREFLHDNPYRARYRDAPPEAGGAAVTVIELG